MLAGVCISSSTVRHHLLEADRKAKKPIKKTENMMKKRLEWARVNKNRMVKD